MRKQLMAALFTAVLIGGTGCSASSDDRPDAGVKTSSAGAEVATLQTGTPSAAAPSPSQAERPRERLDDTEADIKARYQPYEKCMLEHGVDVHKERAGGAKSGRIGEANKACDALMPLPPWELDPANPEAKDFARDVVKCLKGKGVRYVEVGSDGSGWAFGGKNNDADSISKGLKYSPACEREVAAKRK
ncbi:hypothetical protein AB0K20_15935 [Micromonospora matsumotoense]|uniref:hypothetical protein n=1 Tax=Micromonospora matsumotoense TaxID=121616 RepID=UPI003413B682